MNRYLTTLPAIALIALTSASCSSKQLAVGQSSYSSVAGTLRAVEGAPIDKTVRATVAAMKTLSMQPRIRENDAFRALVVVESVFGAISQSHEVRVNFDWLTDTATEIRIRILGRRDQARLERIEPFLRELGETEALRRIERVLA